jgi:hypothetical protein
MVKRAPARRRPRKAKPGDEGSRPGRVPARQPTGAAAEAAEAIANAGGCVVGSYKEPLGGHPILLSILPIDAVEPTPFQRDLSDAHHKRLADVINKTGRFLDPIIAVVAPNGGFWTPNGRHRLEAMRRLGAKSITALVVADREVAWQILALNTEKTHNLKERSLEVIRIYVVWWTKIPRVGSCSSRSTSTNPTWSLSASAMNASDASAVVLTIQSSGDWRALPMNHSAPPSSITRNGPRWCSTLRRKSRQR